MNHSVNRLRISYKPSLTREKCRTQLPGAHGSSANVLFSPKDKHTELTIKSIRDKLQIVSIT